jgi:hypothetical protein
MPKKILTYFTVFLFCSAMWGCSPYEPTLFTNLNNSGVLTLTKYTSIFPTVGPCGPSLPYDEYNITVPRIAGRIESKELKIVDIDSNVKNKYAGYIEFMQDQKVHVALYKITNASKSNLSINGVYNFTVEANTHDGKKI